MVTFVTPARLAKEEPKEGLPGLPRGALERRSLLKILAAKASFFLRERSEGQFHQSLRSQSR